MKFSESHEWIKVDQKVGVVGITGHGQKELGEIVYVEFPKVGTMIKAGEPVAVLESTKAAIDVYSPVSGEIIEVNQSLKGKIFLINEKPETDGWLFKIQLNNLCELDTLLNHQHYLQMIS